MAAQGATLDLTGLAADFGDRARELRGPPRALVRQIGLAMTADAQSNIVQGHTPDGAAYPPLKFNRPSGGGKALYDKGLLVASLGQGGRGFMQEISDWTIRQGTNLEYAGLHQHGGTVTPKRARWLTIPKTVEASRVEARAFPRPLVAIFGKRGGVLIEKSEGRKRGEGVVQYALVRSVTVPARPFLGWGRRLVDTVIGLCQDFYGKLLGER